MKKNRFIVIVVLLVVLVSLLVTNLVNTRKRHVGQGRIVVGAVIDLTGPIAMYGNWMKDGAELALEHWNAIDGNEDAILLVQDSQSDVKKGVSAFQYLLANNDGVPAVLIGPNSSTVLACAPLANKSKVVLFTPTASSPNISNSGEFIFRNRSSGAQEMIELARVISEKFQIKEVGFIALNNDAGIAYEQAFVSAFETRGGQVLQTELLDLGVADFRTQVFKMKNANIDAVVLGSPAKEAATVIKQSAELNYKPKWFSATPIENPTLIEIAGSFADGLVYVAETVDHNNPLFSDFAQKFMDKFGYEPNVFCANAYDGTTILLQAIVSSHGKPDQMLQYLHSLDEYNGVAGKQAFDKQGDVVKKLSVKTVKNGTFQIFTKP
jgi:branched-chain amino acid transport system substrate-binding protein